MRDRVWRWLAWRLPRPLVRWAAVRVLAHATTGPWSAEEVPGVGALTALNRWRG